MNLCIIGAGVSGILLILLLAETSVSLKSISIIDPYFDGGDLFRKWSSVMSNTPWSATLKSIQTHLPSVKIPKWANDLPLDKPTPVYLIAKLIRECAKPVLDKVTCIYGSVESINWLSDKSVWDISISTEQSIKHINSKGICFTYGSQPKVLDIGVPSIPLDIALDTNKLCKYIEPHSKVIVFGTRHSGIHVLKNLVDCSANSVLGVYKGPTPFIFARDGEYDGIKLDGAVIADDILAYKYPSIQMVSNTNISSILKYVRNADWAVYAIGFESTNNIRLSIDSVPLLNWNKYDITGKLLNCPCAWGFGLAYPSQAPDGIHWDVGVSSFLEHIYIQISSILSIIYLIQ